MEVKTVDIENAVQENLAKLFIESVREKILLDDELSLIELSSADDRKNAIYHYDLDDIPSELSQLKSIIHSDNFDPFNFNGDDLDNLVGILVLIGNQDSQLAIYKHQYPITLLKKDSGFSLIKSWNANRFKKLDEDILKINTKFDFFKINGKYYIWDLKALERFSGFHEAVKSVAKKGIENIQESQTFRRHSTDSQYFTEGNELNTPVLLVAR